ncbi:hypothetical protein pb186bvf_010098 [Paramecium bursaria]
MGSVLLCQTKKQIRHINASDSTEQVPDNESGINQIYNIRVNPGKLERKPIKDQVFELDLTNEYLLATFRHFQLIEQSFKVEKQVRKRGQSCIVPLRAENMQQRTVTSKNNPNKSNTGILNIGQRIKSRTTEHHKVRFG